jgi:hypothetical protein
MTLRDFFGAETPSGSGSEGHRAIPDQQAGTAPLNPKGLLAANSLSESGSHKPIHPYYIARLV